MSWSHQKSSGTSASSERAAVAARVGPESRSRRSWGSAAAARTPTTNGSIRTVVRTSTWNTNSVSAAWKRHHTRTR
jgi:hypothetical protein